MFKVLVLSIRDDQVLKLFLVSNYQINEVKSETLSVCQGLKL